MQVLDNVDALLFSMLVLKGLVDSSGKVWRCFPQQLYLVEATYRLTKQVCMHVLCSSAIYCKIMHSRGVVHTEYV